MFPTPTSVAVSAEDARRLDDAFLRTNPTAYFRSRIHALLVTTEDAEPASIAVEFQDILGPIAAAKVKLGEQDRELQVAVDAVQLRAHVAEALMRLLLARLTVRSGIEPQSLWLATNETPTRLEEVLEQLRKHAQRSDFINVFAGMFLPVPLETTVSPDDAQGLQTFLDWVNHAALALSCGHLNLGALHNKIKHGLVVRPDDQTRLTATTTPPAADGGVPLSALTGDDAFDIFDTVVLEYISRPPGKPRQGLERTLLRADPATLLAEAWMLVVTHGALFHTCAYRHFGSDRSDEFMPYPGLPLGPTPAQVRRGKPQGMRFPLTLPPGGGQPSRQAGIDMGDVFVPLRFGQAMEGRVTDG